MSSLQFEQITPRCWGAKAGERTYVVQRILTGGDYVAFTTTCHEEPAPEGTKSFVADNTTLGRFRLLRSAFLACNEHARDRRQGP